MPFLLNITYVGRSNVLCIKFFIFIKYTIPKIPYRFHCFVSWLFMHLSPLKGLCWAVATHQNIFKCTSHVLPIPTQNLTVTTRLILTTVCSFICFWILCKWIKKCIQLLSLHVMFEKAIYIVGSSILQYCGCCSVDVHCLDIKQ